MACAPCRKKAEEAKKKLEELKKAGTANTPQPSSSPRRDTRTGGFFK